MVVAAPSDDSANDEDSEASDSDPFSFTAQELENVSIFQISNDYFSMNYYYDIMNFRFDILQNVF